ncbi:MOSC domain-containing protein [Paracoccus cavernae]|uniref:MOSC domain-containing protein n=1 Tax=Paracoccus cavernae TaxID=1571207 RepID=A0ABT8D944_9RHOB|nr:MOSC domain-containing protein [Paracoccus cavernae]
MTAWTTTFQISELRIGRARPFGPKGVPSAIDKQPATGALEAGALGLAGDEQGDPRHHGGPDKAIHAYARANYAIWRQDLPDKAAHFRAGGFGENLVVEGIDESGICLGDLWQVGGAVLSVSQGRQPCWKLNLRFDQPDMARRVQESGRTGWYFRVAEAGPIRAGDSGRLIGRPHPEWPLTRVSHLLYHDRMNRAALADLAALPDLPENWRRLAEARLANGKTEDWSRRIDTPQ